MAESHPANTDRIGNDFSYGNNPSPGGDVSTDTSAVPPYEGRNDGSERQTDSTARAMGSQAPEHEPVQPGSDTNQPASAMAPDDVGQSINKRGEDAAKGDGKEAGRHDENSEGGLGDRPVGSSDNGDQTGV